MATLEDLERRVVALEKAQNTNTETLEWMAGTLGRVKATTDMHTTRLDRIDETLAGHTKTLADHTKTLAGHTSRLDKIDATLADHTSRLSRIERTVSDLKDSLPDIVANALREVLAANKDKK